MNKHTKRRLDRLFQKYPTLVAGPVSAKTIAEAELELGCQFSPDYREFLEIYGGGIVASDPIFGLRASETIPDTVVEVTQQYREKKWPGVAEWYVFSETADGNPVGADSHGRIWFSDHGVVKPLAESFDDYLGSLLEWATDVRDRRDG